MKFREMLRSDPGASVTIVLLLSFGLGAGTLLYTALDRLLLHPLRVSHPETLVRVGEKHPPVLSWEWFPYSTYLAVRQMHSFSEVAVEGNLDTVFTTQAGAQPVAADMVSGGYFSMLGAAAEIGRALDQADEATAAGSVPVVLSHRFWTREFAASPAIVGSTLSLQGRPFTVVGVMPQRFFGTMLDHSPDLWVPLAAQPLLSKKALIDPETDRHFSIVARLRGGTTVAQAQAEFAGIYGAIQKASGEADNLSQGLIVPILQGSFALRDQFGQALTLLLWGLAALLLMVCANVAGLLLARATRREKDTAVRMALGASRVRIVLHALLESAMLGLAGGCGGALLAWLCAPLLASMLPAGRTPLPVSLVPNAGIDLMAIAGAVGISLIFSAIPASIAARVAPQQVLRRGSATRRAGLLSRGLLVLQIGMTMLLLVGSGLLLRTFFILSHTNAGFEVDHLITFALHAQMAGDSAQVSPKFPAELQQSIQSLPGVRNASVANAAFMQRLGIKTSVALPGRKIPTRSFLNTSLDAVSGTFFDTLGIPILAGRSFSDADAPRSGPVPTVVNGAFARRFFPGENPLGRIFGMGSPGEVATATNVIVGVAGDSKYRSLREDLLPIYYTPMGQQEQDFYLYVRTQGPPVSIIQAARKALFDLNPRLPFSEIVTMQAQLSESLWQERLLAVLAGVFSAISILMAATGLYGLLAYDASQRRREFGIRSAVGAQKSDVALLLLKDMARIVVPGLAIGLAASLLLARVIASALYGIRPFDPLTLAAALLIVAVVGVVSAGQPMLRAMNLDPAMVLRDE